MLNIKEEVSIIRVQKDNLLAIDFDKTIQKIKEIKSIEIVFNNNKEAEWLSQDNPFDVSGFVKKVKENSFIININPFESPRRAKFTKAHEIGHIILNHIRGDIDEIIDSKDNEFFDESDVIKKRTVEFKKDDPEEREANAFAAELLMPEIIVRKQFPSNFISYKDVKKGSEKFEVSEAAMITRFKWLSYILAF